MPAFVSALDPALAIDLTFLSYVAMAWVGQSAAATDIDSGASVPVGDVAAQNAPWRSRFALSSIPSAIERILETAGLDRGPWLAVGFAGGIVGWFALANTWGWAGLVCGALGAALAALVLLAEQGRYPYLRQAIVALGLMVAAGCLTVWGKSALVGTPPIAHAMAPVLVARVLVREDEPAYGDTRLWLATREPRTGRTIRVRVGLPVGADARISEGAVIQLRARLMPPMPPMVPGARDMAREAWFGGWAASGRSIGPVLVLRPAPGDDWLARARHALAAHVQIAVPGSAGGIAATLVAGERGGISAADQQAMRDAGLTHLLAISGLHVSAVVGGAWFLIFRLLGLFPWLALRVRVPLVATGGAALAGIGYTLITGAHLPTVRACAGAMLVLGGMALGRHPLSMRLLAVAAMVVMLLWPESVIDPSFQMSFGSVIAIIALHEAAPVQAFLHGEAPWWGRLLREGTMLLLAGMVIDLALLPVSLYHFHRAGLYGAEANSFAIPLVTFVAMPLIALALALDATGLGAIGFGGSTLGGAVWSGAGAALNLLLRVTRWIVARPGAVGALPAMGAGGYALFVVGMLWLGLWRGRLRLAGLVPALAGVLIIATMPTPDLLITGDGRNLALTDPAAGRLLILRPGRSDYTRTMLSEVDGLDAPAVPLAAWPGTTCNRDACLIELARGGRIWRVLALMDHAHLPAGPLARACAGVDIVVAADKLFGTCTPALLRADHTVLQRTGGLALDLARRRIATVADSEGAHPWWRAPHRLASTAPDFDDAADAATDPVSPAPGPPRRAQ